MLLFFADDARQSNPTRAGMGPIVAAGAVGVPEIAVRVLELQLSKICSDFDFPDGEEFKWSPGRELWMATNLTEDRRRDFYQQVLRAAQHHGVTATVVVQEILQAPAMGVATAEEDVTRLLLEGIHLQIPINDQAIVVADRPGGGRPQEDAFLASCLAAVKTGTRFVRNFELIALFLTTNSRMSRLLQLADLITSCTTATVAGELRWTPPVFAAIRPLLRSDGGRIGGTGLKIHPADRFANLYHWLVGDVDYVHHSTSYKLPLPRYPYATGANYP
jgi:hypothetical protein